MATTGTFEFNLNNVGGITNNTIGIIEKITLELSNQGDIIGIGIAIAISLTLIFAAVFVAIAFIPRLINSVKGIK